MKFKNYQETIEIPGGVEASLDNTNLLLKGPRGELKRNFFDPGMSFSLDANKILITIPKYFSPM